MPRLAKPMERPVSRLRLAQPPASDIQAQPKMRSIGETRDPMKFDRRRFARRAVEHTVRAAFATDDGRRGMLGIAVTDRSVHGLGGWCDTPLPEGTQLGLCPVGVPVPVQSGVVVRCLPEAGRFRIGVRVVGGEAGGSASGGSKLPA
jgi:hypothetical protein